MAQKRKPDQTKLILDAALNLADKSGWDTLTFAAIARKARVKTADVEKRFDDIWDILKWVLSRLEADTDRAVHGNLGDNWRENLMEILMTRLDLAEEHKGAFTSLPRAAMRDPRSARRLSRHFYRSMDHMLQLSGLPRQCGQPLVVAGFGGLFLSVIDTWSRDDSGDKSATMAAIDRRLGMFEKILNGLPSLSS